MEMKFHQIKLPRVLLTKYRDFSWRGGAEINLRNGESFPKALRTRKMFRTDSHQTVPNTHISGDFSKLSNTFDLKFHFDRENLTEFSGKLTDLQHKHTKLQIGPTSHQWQFSTAPNGLIFGSQHFSGSLSYPPPPFTFTALFGYCLLHQNYSFIKQTLQGATGTSFCRILSRDTALESSNAEL